MSRWLHAAEVAGLGSHDYDRQQEDAKKQGATRRDRERANDLRQKQSPAGDSSGISFQRTSQVGNLQQAKAHQSTSAGQVNGLPAPDRVGGFKAEVNPAAGAWVAAGAPPVQPISPRCTPQTLTGMYTYAESRLIIGGRHLAFHDIKGVQWAMPKSSSRQIIDCCAKRGMRATDSSVEHREELLLRQ